MKGVTMWWSKVLSWVIGEVSPLDYILGALLSLSILWIGLLKWDVQSLEDEISKYKTDKALYEQSISQNNEEQKEKIVYVDREVKQIEYQTKEVIKKVKEYVYDANKTNCENGIARIRRTGF